MKKVKALLLVLFMVMGFSSFSKLEFKDDTIVKAAVDDKRELKAVWISAFVGEASYTSETEFKNQMNYTFEILEYYGLNAMIFHVRTHNNAFYKSELNPVASWFSKVNFDVFDPVGWLIEESHKRGIEFHAWMNPYRVSTTYQIGTVPSVNPQSNSSNLLTNSSGATILDPSKPVVRQHIYDTIAEFAELYPNVDAIHFDDYFYISGVASSLSAATKRGHIDALMEGIHNTLKQFNSQNNAHIQFGISPTGIYRNGNGVVTYDSNGNPITTGSQTSGFEHYGDYLYADTVKWSVEGWLDYLMPQVYWARNHPIASFTKILSWWDKVFKNLDTNLYSGVGVYMANNSGTYAWGTNMNELKGIFDEIDTYENVLGYSLYSFKHLRYGYDNSTLLSGQQIRNGYSDPARRTISIPPEIGTFTPVVPDAVSNIKNVNGNITWNGVNNAKFYYIYRSSGQVTYDADEIIGVVDGKTNEFSTSDYTGQYNYGVKALSGTNHLSGASVTPEVPNYTVEFNLNGGSFKSDLYTNRDDMIVDFLTDFYNFLKPDESLDEFIYGFYSDSYYGTFDEYFEDMFEPNNKSVNPNTGKFINQPEYNKWVPLFDLLDEFTIDVNSNQTFWGSPYVAQYRLKDFFNKYNYGKPQLESYFDIIPIELRSEEIIPSSYNEFSLPITLPVPTKDNAIFSGWYNNASFTGGVVTTIPQGSTGDKTFYAKWDVIAPEITLTINFDINYDGGSSPNPQIINAGSRVTRPSNPSRSGYNFLGWFKGDALFNFNSSVYEDTTLTARWAKDLVTVTFDYGYGNLSDTVTIDRGSSVSMPQDPSRSGYIFTGWYSNGNLYNFNNVVNNNITLIANWDQVIEYVTVKFELGYNNLTLTTEHVIRDTKVNKPVEPIRTGYIFTGWYLGNTYFDFNQNIQYSIVLTAKWEKEAEVSYINIMFDYGYSERMPDLAMIISGTRVTKPNDPSRSGYTFNGWYLDGQLFDFNELVNTNLILVASWKEILLEGLVEVVDGASIRVKTGESQQGLRFYAQISNDYKNNPHGFYVMYGKASITDLENELLSYPDNMIINGKKVFNVSVNGYDFKNTFSVILTGIPVIGYLDEITVVPYVIYNGKTYLSKETTTRSIGEVAVKGYESELLFKPIIDEIENNLYKLNDGINNIKFVKDTLYNADRLKLRSDFLADWNERFDENLLSLDANQFYVSARTGSPNEESLTSNRDLSNTNIYKFFNDPIYGEKWGWLLDYILYINDEKTHPTRQIIAIKGDGTNNIDDGWSNRGVLYNANHLSYALTNFFNFDNLNNGFPTLGFTDEALYTAVGLYNDRILANLRSGYIIKDSNVKLPKVNKTPESGYYFAYYDGKDYYKEGDLFNVSKEVTLSVVELYSGGFLIQYYDQGKELIDLLNYYQEGEEVTLSTPTKSGSTFLGWYDNADLTGDAVTKISAGSSGNKKFFAKFEVDPTYLTVTYDLGDYGYYGITKDELYTMFVVDYMNVYNLHAQVETIKEDFFTFSYFAAPYTISDFFTHPVYGEKWGFLYDYILDLAESTRYSNRSDLLEDTPSFWRANLFGFFVDNIYTYNLTTKTGSLGGSGGGRNTNRIRSMNFSNESYANGFWKYTDYRYITADFIFGGDLLDSGLIKISDSNKTFSHYEDQFGNLLTKLPEASPIDLNIKVIYK